MNTGDYYMGELKVPWRNTEDCYTKRTNSAMEDYNILLHERTDRAMEEYRRVLH